MRVIAKTTQEFNGLTAIQIPFGELFKATGYDDPLMRIRPIQMLLNSRLLCDVINRGDVIVVNLHTGNMFRVSGDRECIRLKGEVRLYE